eukprot:11079943-Ditylum_brightwellii.AAC.1
MQDYIGENRTEKGAKEILEGNFDPSKFDNLLAVNYWIKNNLKQVTCKTTSLSPSGCHYGHYKVHSIMMSLPFQYGFTPSRWLKAVDVMLEKDPGSPKINHLQIIVIIEAHMNMIMKVIWARHLVPQAESHDYISQVQLRNRKALSSLHLQSLGLPEMAVTCSVQLNKRMKHYVRTSA